MNTSKDISQLIANTNEDDLRDIVSEWANKHSDSKDYVRNCLCPPVEEVDFGRKLSQVVNRETKEFFSRHDVREATDWGNVYDDLIKPWSENADSLSTEKLYDLCDVIVKEVGMQVTEEDFYGDDWYGDDFSGSIQVIMSLMKSPHSSSKKVSLTGYPVLYRIQQQRIRQIIVLRLGTPEHCVRLILKKCKLS